MSHVADFIAVYSSEARSLGLFLKSSGKILELQNPYLSTLVTFDVMFNQESELG